MRLNLHLTLFFTSAVMTLAAFADLAVHQVQVAPLAQKSRVPDVTAQGRFLAPQAISAVDVSADGKFITVGTMAFSHDANVWQFVAGRHGDRQAPFPAVGADASRHAAWRAGDGCGARLFTCHFSRTRRCGSVEPKSCSRQTLKDEFAEADSRDGQLARLRPGAGDWRTGWFASYLGELFVRGPDWVFKPPEWFLDAEGRRQRVALRGKESPADEPRDAHGGKRRRTSAWHLAGSASPETRRAFRRTRMR